MTSFECPCCGAVIEIDRELAFGEEVSCPNCETVQLWGHDAEQGGEGEQP